MLSSICLCLQSDYTGLLTGSAGQLLLKLCHESVSGKNDNDSLTEALEFLIDQIHINELITFCGGRAGIYWLFKELGRRQLLDKEEMGLLCCEDERLKKTALKMLLAGNTDFLHGAIGIAYYLLYEPVNINDQAFFEQLFSGLNHLLVADNDTGMFQDYSHTEHIILKGKVNMGLAHGIPSILKFCIQCYKQEVCKEEAYKIGSLVVDYILAHTNSHSSQSYFPSIINAEDPQKDNSRLAWCYGDPGTAFILYQAGVAFGNQVAIDTALKVLMHSAGRRSVESTKVFDAGICHGSAGVAHIYNKMWRYTGNLLFEEACDYWIQKTIDFAVFENEQIIYTAYQPVENTNTPSYSLLEGSTGVGLVLYSYLTGDFSWDYCLMLND